MPQKSGDLTATAADENLNRTGISDAADTTGGFRWQLPNDDAGIKLLGESMSTVQELSSLLTFYFCVTGMSLLVMIARSLKLVDFQRHLDLTVRTLSRSSLDLLHFIIIFFITLLLSMMMGHLMVGPTEESLSRLDLAFNLHFEFILGSSLDILAKLFTDRSIVRSEIEYAALVIYSFGVPIFLLFILVNLILGIVGDSFGEEKENLGELNEPTLLDDFISTVAYRYGRFRGKYPSYTELVRLLKSVRSSKMSKAQEVLAKGLGTVDSLAPTGDGKKIGAGAAKKKFTGPVTEQKIPGNAVTSGSGHGKKINPKADKDQDFDEMAHIERVINGVNTPEQSARARSRWALFKAKGLRANILLRALGVDLNDLRRKDPMEQLALAEKQGIGLLVDVMSKTEDVDSDSDSSVDEDTKARRHHQRAVRGEARATAWDAVKAYSNPPQVNPNDNDWQSLMDDSWNEFMSNVKDKQARKTSARMFRLRGLGLFTEAEVTQWLLDADDSAQKNGYFGYQPPSRKTVKSIIRSIADNKVQQFGAADSDEEEEEAELNQLIEMTRDIKDNAIGKMQRYIQREITWQQQTLAWQQRVTAATEKMEEELMMTHQTMSDLRKKSTAYGVGELAGEEPVDHAVVRERMWATLQAKRALREALLHAPGGGLGSAALEILVGKDNTPMGRSTEEPESVEESLASERESDLESETEQSIAPSTASGRGAGGKKNKGKAASEGERTTTTSSMRRHRVAKKEKAAKKSKYDFD